MDNYAFWLSVLAIIISIGTLIWTLYKDNKNRAKLKIKFWLVMKMEKDEKTGESREVLNHRGLGFSVSNIGKDPVSLSRLILVFENYQQEIEKCEGIDLPQNLFPGQEVKGFLPDTKKEFAHAALKVFAVDSFDRKYINTEKDNAFIKATIDWKDNK